MKGYHLSKSTDDKMSVSVCVCLWLNYTAIFKNLCPIKKTEQKMKIKLSVFAIACMFFLTPTQPSEAIINFTPRLSTGVEYTDNLFLSDQDKESDYITSATPGFTIDLSGQRAGLGLSYDPSYKWYSRYDENNGGSTREIY